MAEQAIAREAFDKAYDRETSALLEAIRTRASAVSHLDDIWRLNDFLSARRHDIDGKYDYNYTALLFVFSRLVKEGWLQVEELKGLGSDKVAKITALARM